jgi:arylsulfatase A-like enzyme/thioredoxin-like negative regulator of GroEL
MSILPGMRRAGTSFTPVACALFALASACAGAAGCGRSSPPPAQSATPANDVLLITIDTARADRFSYSGAPGPGTPRIDALAREGAGFVEAISPAPLTKPAHASLMTGRLPPSHTVRDNGAYRLPDSETTLAEVLRNAGFTTAAFVGSQVLDARYGFNQGFATYDDTIPVLGDSAVLSYAERRGEDVASAAERWLGTQSGGRLFAWVHLFDPHAPYRPPEPERSRYPSAYDGEIAYVDRVVGSLLDAWQARRGLDRTLVVVTADHGEALGEHDEATHGVLVHDATLRVPLVIRAPGLRLPRSIGAPVSLIDVMPTILGLLQLAPPAGVQGRDLTPLMRGESLVWSRESGYSESLYAEIHHGCAPLRALREGNFKLVRGSADELYDLTRDPHELRDVAATEPARTRDLGDALDRLVAELHAGTAEAAPLDDESRRALESLGYSWTPSASPASGRGRDPREALRSMKTMAEADRSFARGDVPGAVASYREVLTVEPASVDARVRLAQVLVTQGRYPEAARLLAAAAAIAPKEPELRRRLGDALFAMKKYREALEAYDTGLALHPAGHDIRDARWRVLNQIGRHDDMLAEAERAVAADPSDGMARYARALACCGRGSDEAYIAALKRELAQLPGDASLEAALANAHAK